VVQRLDEAEQRIEQLELLLPEERPDTDLDETLSQDAQLALSRAGFDDYQVDQIQTIRNQQQLQRLDLRDRATREGWINSDQFRDAIRELSSGKALRDSLGDENYDRLLLAEGRPNRVRVDSIIDGSAADEAGVQVDDIVFNYAGERIFSVRGLQQATTAGERDEPVSIQVVRDDELVGLVIRRGPMGVTISASAGDGSPLQ